MGYVKAEAGWETEALEMSVRDWLRLRGAHHLEAAADKNDDLVTKIIVDNLFLQHRISTDNECDFSLMEDASGSNELRNVLTIYNGGIYTDTDNITVTQELIWVDWGAYSIGYKLKDKQLIIERVRADVEEANG